MLHFTLVLLAWLAATVGAVPTVHQLQTSLAPGQGAVLGAWRSWHADMARIRMDGQPLLTPDVMPAQYAWTLNPAQLQRAFVSRAKGPRLRRVVHRLMRGRPVKLGVIGTSVSWGTGPSKRGTTDWVSMLPLAIKLLFPAANVTARNGCVPATGSGFANMCLNHMVDADVDLLILDFVTNDFVVDIFFTNPHQVTLERLIRKSLQMEHRPGVVLMQIPAWGQMFNTSREGHKLFHESAEEMYGVLAQYYRLPTLSFRNAWWHEAEGATPLCPNGWDSVTATDQVHPNDVGHRSMLDMLLWLLLQTALEMRMQPMSRADSLALTPPLPAPMHPGNFEEPQVTCLQQEQLQVVVDMQQSQGWALVNEGTAEKRKFGYISTTANTHLTLSLDVRGLLGTKDVAKLSSPVGPGKISPAALGVSISYLKSYTNMGTASWECMHGCTCASMVLDAHHAQKTSTSFVALNRVTATGNQCVMRIAILPTTTSGAHKFKVSALMVGRWGNQGLSWDSNVTTEWRVEDWLSGAIGASQIDT